MQPNINTHIYIKWNEKKPNQNQRHRRIQLKNRDQRNNSYFFNNKITN